MSRLILSQITIKKERSISSTTWYYLLQPSNASAPDPTNYGSPPPTITTTGYSGWSTTEPTYNVGDDRILYIMVQTNYTDGTYSYSTPTISSSYETAKQTYQEIIDAQEEIDELSELGLKEGHFWYNTTEIPAGTFPVYPIGAYAASGLSSPTFNTKNSNSYGVNTWFSTQGLKIRYNAIPLAELSSSELAFYYPSTTVSSAKKAISLGIDNAITSLRFYGFNNNSPDAILTSNGLKLVKGGIEGGNYSSSSTNFIYLSTNDYNGSPTITINGNNSGWRQIIGSKFGVKNDGTLYANNAVISGTITITGHEDDLDTELSTIQSNIDNILVYDHIYNVTTDNNDNITSVTFTAKIYRSGVDVTNEFNNENFTWYYKNEDNFTEQPINNNINNTPQNSGKTITINASTPVDLSILSYGVEIIGKFSTGGTQTLLTTNGDELADNSNHSLLSTNNVSGNTIRVRDLEYTTSLASSNALMVVTSEDEKLVTVENLASALNVGVSDVKINNTSIVSNGVATIPKSSNNDFGVVKTTTNTSGGPPKLYLQLETNNTTYNIPLSDSNGMVKPYLLPTATTTTPGAMSATDKTKLDTLQPLVSGETIKTINGNSIVGSGNLIVEGGTGGSILYGTCSTSAGIAEKVVTLINGSLESVSIGTQIIVKFTNYNYATNPYLSIDGIDDIYIKKYGTTAPGTTVEMSWQSGSTISFTYDGTYWQMNNWLNTNTTYSPMTESLAISGIGTAGYLITSSILKKAITHHAYPIGSIFETTTNVHPNTILYGQWKKISQPPIDTFELITSNDTSIITNSNNNLEVSFVLTNKWVRIS